MNVLVTGAAGYIGTNLIKKLAEYFQEHQIEGRIIGADVKEPTWDYPDVKFVQLDVRSPEVEKI